MKPLKACTLPDYKHINSLWLSQSYSSEVLLEFVCVAGSVPGSPVSCKRKLLDQKAEDISMVKTAQELDCFIFNILKMIGWCSISKIQVTAEGYIEQIGQIIFRIKMVGAH